MITPNDIQSVEFARGVRGYKEEDVDAFLVQISESLQYQIDQNKTLKDQIELLSNKLADYKKQEAAVINTLEAAKSLMNDISASAEKRADILLKNAQLDADLIEKQTRESVEKLKREESGLYQRIRSIKTRFRTILEDELDRFDGLADALFDSTDDSRIEIFSDLATTSVKTVDIPSSADINNQVMDGSGNTITDLKGIFD